MYGVAISISSPFYDSYPLLKPKFIKSIFVSRSKLYFRLRKKRIGTKWNNFEDTFKMHSKIATEILSEEDRSNLEYLFRKGYFNYVVNTSLIAETLYREKFAGKREGRVVFTLPIDIVQDVDSLRMAMDVAAQVAKKMDKTVKNYKFLPNRSIIKETKKSVYEFLKNIFNE